MPSASAKRITVTKGIHNCPQPTPLGGGTSQECRRCTTSVGLLLAVDPLNPPSSSKRAKNVASANSMGTEESNSRRRLEISPAASGIAALGQSLNCSSALRQVAQ